jgi:hypothetical protein
MIEPMMRFILVLFLSIGCTTLKVKPPTEDLVSVDSALTHAQMSYQKGCVDASKDESSKPAFVKCRDRAKNHRKEIESIMNQKVEP